MPKLLLLSSWNGSTSIKGRAIINNMYTFSTYHNILWFNVCVNHVTFSKMIKKASNRNNNICYFLIRKEYTNSSSILSFMQVIKQIWTIDELHEKSGIDIPLLYKLPHTIKRGSRGMINPRKHINFTINTSHRFGIVFYRKLGHFGNKSTIVTLSSK